MSKTKWQRVAILFVTAILLIGITMFDFSSDPSSRSPKIITIAPRMTMKDFIAINDLSVGPRIKHGFAINADKIDDVSPIFFDDHWIKLEVRDDEYSFTLPPGRTLFIRQEAGRIIGFAFRPFAQPQPLEEIRTYIITLLENLEAKGWKPSHDIKVPEEPEDLGFSGENLFANLNSASGNSIQLYLTDYGLAPKSESFILALNPSANPAEASHTYLLQVTVNDADIARVMSFYGNLVEPRRIFVNGSRNEALPLRAWIDDPDWTPQQAGMVEVPAEERTKIDPLFWKIPSNAANNSR
jgi:hypothetical protein